MVARPASYSDPNAVSTGYCAFHDYTYPNLEGGIYNAIKSNAMNDIKGNRGSTLAVQSLWSNQAAEGAGYCAGAGDDLP